LNTPKKSVLQDWTSSLGIRHQGVLLGAFRGCDTAPKQDPSKALVRCFRSITLNCFCGDPAKAKTYIEQCSKEETQSRFDLFVKSLDHYPLHYLMHFIHAMEVVGYKHPDLDVRELWASFYRKMCRALHVNPETEQQMDLRLNADEESFFALDRT
jgi:hypothetical protein